MTDSGYGAAGEVSDTLDAGGTDASEDDAMRASEGYPARVGLHRRRRWIITKSLLVLELFALSAFA